MISTVYYGSTIITKVTPNSSLRKIKEEIHDQVGLSPEDYYVLVNGRRVGEQDLIPRQCNSLNIVLRQVGGKGGFGSMLRAIGAQIEKTTNREACRDLSGRRLRDINEEKRLKVWLEKQKDAESEKKERKKQKLERLLKQPEFEFTDKEYEKARSEMTEKVDEAVEQGFKKAVEIAGSSGIKRKTAKEIDNVKAKKKKTTLWIADDLSSSSDTDSDSSDEETQKKSSKSDKEKVEDPKRNSDESNQSCASIIDK